MLYGMAKHIDRKLRDQEKMRLRILRAALDIAVAEGWERVTVRKIADAVEYTTSVVYTHFKNKEAVLQQLVETGYEEMYERCKKSIERESDPIKQLLVLSSVNWDFARENAALYQLMIAKERPLSQTAKEASKLIDDIFIRLTGKKGPEVKTLRLNWLCLRQGAISLLMSKDPAEAVKNKRLYLEFIARFIAGI